MHVLTSLISRIYQPSLQRCLYGYDLRAYVVSVWVVPSNRKKNIFCGSYPFHYFSTTILRLFKSGFLHPPAREIRRNKLCFEWKNIHNSIPIICHACALMNYWAGLYSEVDKKILEAGVNSMMQITMRFCWTRSLEGAINFGSRRTMVVNSKVDDVM
jgi:hypothetical protein